MNRVSFFVPGIPKPGGSKKIFPIKKGGVPTGKFIVTDAAGQANKDWRASVVQFAFEAMKKANIAPFQGALRLELQFVMPRPKYHYLKGGLRSDAPTWHATMPDATKLTRAVEDALTGLCWRDDAQVAQQSIQKCYSCLTDTTGCSITITEIA